MAMTERRFAAARWAERLSDEASEADYRAFDQWSGESENAAVYEESIRVRRIASDLADAPELQSLCHAALARAARGARRRRVAWPTFAAAAAAAAALGAVAIGLPAALGPRNEPTAVVTANPTTYETAVGQKLEVALEDGSRVTLDTGTRVHVAYSGDARRLILERGQAMFTVAKGQRRRFIVDAGGQEVVAHGTEFSVRYDPGGVKVTLIEGRVSVRSRGVGAVAMRPADVLTAGPAGVSLRHDPAAIATATSWRFGMVVVEDRPLTEVVAEMNRYATTPMVVDPAAGRIRISGSFRAGDVGPFVEALKLGFPVDARIRANERTELSLRD
jgi:transmembrane sensor